MNARCAPLAAWLLLALAVLPVAAACGGAAGGGDSAAPRVRTTIPVSLIDFAVRPERAVAAAGDVHFLVTNDGTARHELAVVRSDLPVDALPMVDLTVVEDAVTVVGRTETLPAGAGGDVTVRLEAGRYLLICNVDGHYALGMRLEFSVE